MDSSEQDVEVLGIIEDLNLHSKLSTRGQDSLARYIDDMRKAMLEVARVLTPKGKAVYVIGENTIRGAFIRNAQIVSAVGKLCGLQLEERHTRALPANRRYLPPPSRMRKGAALDARMRREVILKFKKQRKPAQRLNP